MEVASFPAFDSDYPVFDRLHNASDQKLDSGKAASDQKLDGGKAWERGYMEAEEWWGFPLPCKGTSPNHFFQNNVIVTFGGV